MSSVACRGRQEGVVEGTGEGHARVSGGICARGQEVWGSIIAGVGGEGMWCGMGVMGYGC